MLNTTVISKRLFFSRQYEIYRDCSYVFLFIGASKPHFLCSVPIRKLVSAPIRTAKWNMCQRCMTYSQQKREKCQWHCMWIGLRLAFINLYTQGGMPWAMCLLGFTFPLCAVDRWFSPYNWHFSAEETIIRLEILLSKYIFKRSLRKLHSIALRLIRIDIV